MKNDNVRTGRSTRPWKKYRLHARLCRVIFFQQKKKKTLAYTYTRGAHEVPAARFIRPITPEGVGALIRREYNVYARMWFDARARARARCGNGRGRRPGTRLRVRPTGSRPVGHPAIRGTRSAGPVIDTGMRYVPVGNGVPVAGVFRDPGTDERPGFLFVKRKAGRAHVATAIRRCEREIRDNSVRWQTDFSRSIRRTLGTRRMRFERIENVSLPSVTHACTCAKPVAFVRTTESHFPRSDRCCFWRVEIVTTSRQMSFHRIYVTHVQTFLNSVGQLLKASTFLDKTISSISCSFKTRNSFYNCSFIKIYRTGSFPFSFEKKICSFSVPSLLAEPINSKLLFSLLINLYAFSRWFK